ncbi:MAG: hypothetical protein ACR2J8_00140, partial [Thermomicrobiales bacterium]
MVITHPATSGELVLFDGLAPFVAGLPHLDTNWSKVPFARLERDDRLAPGRADAIAAEWDAYLATMAGLGYTAVAVDDLAHLVSHAWYPAPLRRLLADYRALYVRLFTAARAHGLGVYAVTDYCFSNPAIDARMAETGASELDFFLDAVDVAFRDFPVLDGLVVRLGESDGVDVADRFTSRL